MLIEQIDVTETEVIDYMDTLDIPDESKTNVPEIDIMNMTAEELEELEESSDRRLNHV